MLIAGRKQERDSTVLSTVQTSMLYTSNEDYDFIWYDYDITEYFGFAEKKNSSADNFHTVLIRYKRTC